jgi:acetate kinase
VNSGSILVVNAGSSSLKFSLFRAGAADVLQQEVRGQIDGVGSRPRLVVKDHSGSTLVERDFAVAEVREVKDAIALVGTWLREQFEGESLLAVGHRVVHGGTEFSRPMLVNATVFSALEKLIPLAPLHQPHNLAAIQAVRETQPEIPQVACFDTAFHRSHPQLADIYALPWEYYQAGVRRYGFHGLSYEYIAATLPQAAHPFPSWTRRRVCCNPAAGPVPAPEENSMKDAAT